MILRTSGRLSRRIAASTIVGFTAMLLGAQAQAQSLGAASSFAIQGSAGVTAAGPAGTIVAGDVGASPNASITGFPPAVVLAPFGLHPNDAPAIAAQAADTALFTSLGTGACTDNPTPQMSGANFGPGVHCFATTADLAASSNMTLTGAGVYIFRVPTGLTANVLSTVTLAGVDPCTVFWQVGSAATVNGVNFPGNVVAQAGVTVGAGASLSGRALATNGPVTLSGGNTVGGCSANGGSGGGGAIGGGAAATAIPTLSDWGTMALTLLLLGSVVRIRRKARR
jgi:ice-binding like protein